MNKRTQFATAATAAMSLPSMALAHPNGHDGLTFEALGTHMASDPHHLMILGGVIGAGLLAVGIAMTVRAVKARRQPARRR